MSIDENALKFAHDAYEKQFDKDGSFTDDTSSLDSIRVAIEAYETAKSSEKRTFMDKLTIGKVERALQRGKTVNAEMQPILHQLLDIMRENEELKQMLDSIPTTCRCSYHIMP